MRLTPDGHMWLGDPQDRTPWARQLSFDRYLTQIAEDTASLVTAAGRSGWSDLVETCPNWDLAAMIDHLTQMLRMATGLITGREQVQVPRVHNERLVEHLTRTARWFMLALRAAPADLDAPTDLPNFSPRMYWARRMAHETTIHRVDAELVAGYGITPIDGDYATDGIDELLLGYLPRRFRRFRPLEPFSIAVTPLDINTGWTVNAASSGVTVNPRVVEFADMSLFGMVADLYRWLWNRGNDDEIGIRGRTEFVDSWRAEFKVKLPCVTAGLRTPTPPPPLI